MATSPRDVHSPSQQDHAVPRSNSRRYSRPVPPQPPSSTEYGTGPETAQGIATGAIGSGYGPYSYNANIISSYIHSATSRFGAAFSDSSLPRKSGDRREEVAGIATVVEQPEQWDAHYTDLDDTLHDPSRMRDGIDEVEFSPFSARGWANMSMLTLLIAGLLTLFIGYPVITQVRQHNPKVAGFGFGGINGSGQIPNLPNMPQMIDVDTPQSAMTRVGTDGKEYNLVFSDEFETEGRTFWPGDDPFWEAVNLHYWPTGDLEWYDPQAITTANGKLVITVEEIENHDLNFRSGMLQSWNKFCFTTGYVEVSVSLPGSPKAPGFWPAIWTMGNLGRAGYGATTEGMWPYSYDSCDLGTLPNQTDKNGNPAAAATGGINGGPLSQLPGQKTSACTCPGSDHPGPSVNKGRGVPEIDIFEAQVATELDFQAEVSQSYQIAPFDIQYQMQTDFAPIYNSNITATNPYHGGPLQQAASRVTFIDSGLYNDNAYGTYAFEWWSDPNDRDAGYITWFSNPTGSPSTKSWTIQAQAIGPDSESEVNQRLISEEPHSLIINLGMAPSFQPQDFKHMKFPAQMFVDYVRVYQRTDVQEGTSCDPSSHPTANYITQHLNAYSDPNLTNWAQAGYEFPKNSLADTC